MCINVRTVLSVIIVTLLASTAGAQGLKCTIPALPNTEADHALAGGDAPKAEGLFTAQLSSAPTAANYTGLVHAQLEQDKVSEALTSAQRAVSALPTSADAQALVGDVLTRSGDIPGASGAYVKALALDRCSAAANFGFGRLNDLTGRHLSASKEYSFAHRLAPNDPEITVAYLRLLPAEQRLPPMRALLASHPALPPARLAQLTDEVAILTQHLTCRTEPFSTQTFGLEPLFQNGRYRRSWGLKSRVNDVALPLLELDSSVDGIVLNVDDAAKAKVRPLTTIPSAAKASYIGVAGMVRIGDVTYQDCPVTVVPNSHVDNRNSLIGTNFFRDHVIHIDYVAMTLKLTALPMPPAGETELTDQFVAADEKDWSPVYIAGPNVLLPTLINKKGPFLFAVDTGIGPTVVSPAVTKSQLWISKDRTTNLQGYSGEIVKVVPRDGGVVDIVDVRGPDGKLLDVSGPVKFPVLRFASNEAAAESTISFDITPMSHADGVEISGLLGFHILSYYSLDLNYRDALAHILFDQNRRYHVRLNDLAY